MSMADNSARQIFAADRKIKLWETLHPLCLPGFDPDADDWFFCEHAPGKEQNVRYIHLHFSNVAGQQVSYLIKQYAVWRLGRVRPVTVRLELEARLGHWVRYLRVRRISDPAVFGAEELERFGQWLRMQQIAPKTWRRIVHTVFQLIAAGQRLGWRVTTDRLPEESEWYEAAERPFHKREETHLSAVGATEPIPKELYEKIIRHALEDETDEITRAGIIIQSQTGLRISEVLSLKENCLKREADGSYRLCYSLKKTTKAEPEQRSCPANSLVIEAVQRLRVATTELRKESGRRELFLIRNHGIRPVSQTNWNRGRLHSFLKRWNITDENGETYALHSHQFRATYVRDQLLAGAQIEQIRCRFGHVSSEMTARYVHLSEEEIIDCLTPCMAAVGR